MQTYSKKEKARAEKNLPIIKRQLLDHYIKGMCSLISHFGIYTKEITSPNAFFDRHLIQTDDVDFEFSKVFTQYIKNIQHQAHKEQTRYLQTTYSHLSIAIYLY